MITVGENKMSEYNFIFEKIKVLKGINEEIKRKIDFLHVFRDNYYKMNVIFVTNKDQVYCFGNNCNGVLGFGHENVVNEFVINEEISNKTIVDIKNGMSHTIARSECGKLYSWGWNTYLGIGSADINISKPQLNKYLINENIIDMCCGSSHTLVLTSNKEVYAWGGNFSGQIGNTSNCEHVLIPFKVNEFNGEKVEAISCGFYHSMVLLESGFVYSWGYNRWGQLGIKNKDQNNEYKYQNNEYEDQNNEYEDQNKPKCIQIKTKIKKICCSFSHSLLLSSNGDIYVFGCNEFGQIVGLEANKLLTPSKFIDIASHFQKNISIALSGEGIIFIWGQFGQDEIYHKPYETQFKSFDEVLVNYFQIISKTLHFERRYDREFNELEMIGFGNFSIVYKAVNKRDNKIFAIKKIPFSYRFEKVLKEINIWSELRSERIVKLESFWIEKNYYFKSSFETLKTLLEKSIPSHGIFNQNNSLLLHIQMELCYKTLKQAIEIVNEELKQRYSEVMDPLGYCYSSEIFIQILEGVDYLHKNNIIHRDLKPNNILITDGKNGRFVKIADFGIVTIHEFEEQSHTQYMGTTRFIAPEVMFGKSYNTKVDIYSLGVVAQELFNIDINSPIGEKSCLEAKYKSLFELIEKMLSLRERIRPSCEKILDEKILWALDLNEFQIKYEERKSYPKSFYLNRSFNQIYDGSEHSIVTTKRKSIFNEDNENIVESKPKCDEIEIKKISFGQKHSLLLSREGDIYVFDWNKLRLSSESDTQLTLTKKDHSEKFIDIASHYDHNILAALSEKGFYYVWGQSGRMIFNEHKITRFRSFDGIFSHLFGTTYKMESNNRYYSEFNELEMIAFGSFGIVCKAVNKRDNKIFAIKKIPISYRFEKSFLKEIIILLHLKSERIVEVESFWIENNYLLRSEALLKKLTPSHGIFDQNNTLLLHIQMELCYKTLKQAIEIVNEELKQKQSEVMDPLGYYISSEIFIEILESVDYLHKQNIIHRDLKPSNILITDGTKGHFVKVADFGLATFHGIDGQLHTKYKGARKYMAPEVMQTRKYGTKADIYSLGISALKLFNIDINKPIGEKSFLETEYSNLFSLIVKMCEVMKNKRPSCENILKEKSKWAFNLNQLMKTNLQMKSMEGSFHMFFIQTKLNSRIKNCTLNNHKTSS